jgi:rhodanese-related sulfurtransferase
MKTIFLVLAMFFSSPSAWAEPVTEFCNKVPAWPLGQLVPDYKSYIDAGVGTPIEPDFMKSKYRTRGWVFIDARGQDDRSVGKIPKTVLMTADYRDPKLNELTPGNFVAKVNKYLKKYQGVTKKLSIEALAHDYKFIIYCNGKKCHRSSYGACLLRTKIGVPAENVYIMLGGFPEWKAAGYPVR